MRRSIEALGAKFHVHNQPERAARFKYLIDSFKKKPMRQEGISDAHMSMVHLLFLLSSNPVGQDGYIDEEVRGSVGTKTFLTVAQATEQHKEYVEDQIRKIQQEEPESEEESEDSLDDDDGFSSEDIDEENQDAVGGERRRQASPSRPLHQTGASPHLAEAGHRNFESEDGGKVRNRQMFFGGLPLNNSKATLLVERRAGPGDAGAGFSPPPRKAKRFSTEAFLDLYLQEKNKPLATFDQVQQQMALEKETQSQLKEVLGIRTFD